MTLDASTIQWLRDIGADVQSAYCRGGRHPDCPNCTCPCHSLPPKKEGADMTAFPTALAAGWRPCWCGWWLSPLSDDCLACELWFQGTFR